MAMLCAAEFMVRSEEARAGGKKKDFSRRIAASETLTNGNKVELPTDGSRADPQGGAQRLGFSFFRGPGGQKAVANFFLFRGRTQRQGVSPSRVNAPEKLVWRTHAIWALSR